MSHFQGGYDGQKHVSIVLLLFTVFLRCKLTGSLFEAPVHTAGFKAWCSFSGLAWKYNNSTFSGITAMIG